MTPNKPITSLLLIVACCVIAACARTPFQTLDLPESADIADAPFPRLVDIPSPPQGPDPATGAAIQIDLAAAAEAAETRRRQTTGPVN